MNIIIITITISQGSLCMIKGGRLYSLHLTAARHWCTPASCHTGSTASTTIYLSSSTPLFPHFYVWAFKLTDRSWNSELLVLLLHPWKCPITTPLSPPSNVTLEECRGEGKLEEAIMSPLLITHSPMFMNTLEYKKTKFLKPPAFITVMKNTPFHFYSLTMKLLLFKHVHCSCIRYFVLFVSY